MYVYVRACVCACVHICSYSTICWCICIWRLRRETMAKHNPMIETTNKMGSIHVMMLTPPDVPVSPYPPGEHACIHTCIWFSSYKHSIICKIHKHAQPHLQQRYA